MWSIGCIIAEFYNKKVFLRAATINEYLENLVQLLGLPPKHIEKQIRNKDYLEHMKRIEPTTKRISFREALPNAPQAAIELIEKLMTYDPAERLSAKEVLRHPFLKDLYDPLNDD